MFWVILGLSFGGFGSHVGRRRLASVVVTVFVYVGLTGDAENLHRLDFTRFWRERAWLDVAGGWWWYTFLPSR